MTPETVWEAMGRLRRDYADETVIPISIAGIPLLTYQTSEDGKQTSILEQERSDKYGGPGPAYGRSLSARIVRLMENGYGTTFLTRRALGYVPRWCDGRHRDKGDPLHAMRPDLCYQVVSIAVRFALSSGEFALPPGLRYALYARLIRKAARDAELSETDTAALILGAIHYIDSKRNEILAAIAA